MEEKKQEYFLLRKLLDPVSFLQHFVRIETPNGYEKWVLDPYQKHLLRDFSRSRVINKSKKTGISTTIAGEALYRSYLYPGRQVIFVSTGQRIAQEIMGKFYDEYDSMPTGIKADFKNRSIDSAEFPNKTRIFSVPSHNPANIRGLGMRGSATDVYNDEFAHVVNDHELWIVTRDFQRMGGRITLNSTPKGKRGEFYKIAEPLQAVYRGKADPVTSEWSYHEINFRECPRLASQEEELRKDLTEMDFNQEYNSDFEDESVSFFPYEVLQKAQKVTEFVPDGYRTKNLVQMGIDFGQRVSETVVYIVEEIEPEKFKTIYIEILPGLNYPAQIETIKMLDRSFNPSVINIDATGPGGQVMNDYLQKEESLSGKVFPHNLMSTFKEKIIIRTRVLVDRVKFLLPDPKSGCQYADKVEREFHSIQRTTTETGEHTRYSGKSSGMDDIVWAAALAVYRESTIISEPYFVQVKDKVLDKLIKEEEKNPMQWQLMKEWEA